MQTELLQAGKDLICRPGYQAWCIYILYTYEPLPMPVTGLQETAESGNDGTEVQGAGRRRGEAPPVRAIGSCQIFADNRTVVLITDTARISHHPSTGNTGEKCGLAITILDITELAFTHFMTLLGLKAQRGDRSCLKALDTNLFTGFLAIAIGAFIDAQ